MMYRYFVTFFKGKTEQDKTFGQTVLTLNHDITDIEYVKYIEKYLCDKLGVQVALIGFNKFAEVEKNVNNFS